MITNIKKDQYLYIPDSLEYDHFNLLNNNTLEVAYREFNHRPQYLKLTDRQVNDYIKAYEENRVVQWFNQNAENLELIYLY
jgi:hypothetical protein